MRDIEAIRQAIAAGEFERAGGLWRDYAAAIEDEIRRGACAQAQVAEARELLNWARIHVRCAITHWRDQLAALSTARSYAPLPPNRSRLLRRIL